jgi:uncharacterized protein
MARHNGYRRMVVAVLLAAVVFGVGTQAAVAQTGASAASSADGGFGGFGGGSSGGGGAGGSW